MDAEGKRYFQAAQAGNGDPPGPADPAEAAPGPVAPADPAGVSSRVSRLWAGTDGAPDDRVDGPPAEASVDISNATDRQLRDEVGRRMRAQLPVALQGLVPKSIGASGSRKFFICKETYAAMAMDDRCGGPPYNAEELVAQAAEEFDRQYVFNHRFWPDHNQEWNGTRFIRWPPVDDEC